jgi:ADP-ribose pyrophosphatase YjhB (NUDIX family)
MPISEYLKNLRSKVGNELLLVPSVAAVIKDEEGRVLLIKRSDNRRWSLPAGGIDPGETPAQAITREVQEETGLRVGPTRVLGVFGGEGFRHTYENGDRVEFLCVLFKCEVLGGRLEAIDGEALGFRYFETEDLPDLILKYPRHVFAREEREAFFEKKMQ